MAQPTVPADQLRQLIAETLSHDSNIRSPAEQRLNEAQKTQGHLVEVAKIVASSDGADPAVRQAAAVHFKNTVKKGWDVNSEDGTHGIKISPEERNTIKTHLVELMCTTPPQIQAQLSESISLIAKVDYPQNWDNLLGELVLKFTSPDPAVVNGVLKTIDSICRSFRNVGRSDDLYLVIQYTLDRTQAQLLALFINTGQAVDAAANDASVLRPRLESLRLICSIFYSLNYQDVPAFFEDHMAEYVREYAKYLSYNNPTVTDPNEENEPSPIDELQVAIIRILHLYGNKDEEFFVEMLPQFMQLVWTLLTGLTNQPKHDALATTCMNFVGMLIERPMYMNLFQNEETLQQIVVKIVIPNLTPQARDVENFEDDPQEYIITEVEGRDSQSRRRCALDLLKGSCRLFEQQVTTICSVHVGTMLADYATDPDSRWASKDAAIHVMMGIAVRRESPQGGVTEVNSAVNVLDIFQSQILSELQDSNQASRPVLKATALKYVSVFRNQFSREQLIQLIPLLIMHLNSPNVVVHTFAAYTLERILVTKETVEGAGRGRRKIGSAELREFLNPLFTALFAIVDNTQQNENEYVMKCVMRSLATAGRDVVPVTPIVIEKLTAALIRVAKNPRNPHFNHYLFESIAILVKNVCSQDPNQTASFEPLLFVPFNSILNEDVAEFTPYVFQILAQLLEYRPDGTELGESYKSLFVALLKPTIWESKGNVPALARLVQAYVRKAPLELVPHLNGILGICQKLIATKATEASAFEILNTAIIHFPREEILQRLPTLLHILLSRLKQANTEKYTRLITTLFAIVAGHFGAQVFFDTMNSVQNGLGSELLNHVWIPRLRSDPPVQRMEVKAHSVGLTRLLCESDALLVDDAGRQVWSGALASLVSLLTSSALTTNVDGIAQDSDDVTEVDAIGYESTFSKLVFATKTVEDPFPECADPRATFVQSLHGLLSSNQQAQVLSLIQQGLGQQPKLASELESMFGQAGLKLS